MAPPLIIDADTHITEPPDVWTARVPKRLLDRVPHMVRNDEGKDIWLLEGERIYTVGVTATAGWTKPFPNGPPTLDECHPAAYDSAARLRYMDEVGIWAQVLYPNVGGFGSQRFLRMDDAEVKLACVQAYNDFLRDCASVDARRLITIMATPFWDIDATVAEVQRGAAARPPGHPVHRRAAALRAALPRRPALGPAVVRRSGRRPRHPLPHRQRGHRRRRSRPSGSPPTATEPRTPTRRSSCS